MICAAALFALLLVIYFVHADAARKRNIDKQIELEKAYTDKNLAKMEYDVAVYDEDAVPAERHAVAVASAEEEKGENKAGEPAVAETARASETSPALKPSAGEILFGKVDDEGLEEITGDYKGD